MHLELITMGLIDRLAKARSDAVVKRGPLELRLIFPQKKKNCSCSGCSGDDGGSGGGQSTRLGSHGSRCPWRELVLT